MMSLSFQSSQSGTHLKEKLQLLSPFQCSQLLSKYAVTECVLPLKAVEQHMYTELYVFFKISADPNLPPLAIIPFLNVSLLFFLHLSLIMSKSPALCKIIFYFYCVMNKDICSFIVKYLSLKKLICQKALRWTECLWKG